jgi:hypothetical protein
MNKHDRCTGGPVKAEDYTHIVVLVRGGCVQGAKTNDGRPVVVTVHDYDVHEADVHLPDHDIRKDPEGEYFERLIA